MIIPFVKAHGAGNDFLYTFLSELEAAPSAADIPGLARSICHRHTGPGADGWYLIEHPVEGADARIRLWNSDGSSAALSGNGTRCAAAILLERGLAPETVRLLTGAGLKRACLIRRDGRILWFEMEMGTPRIEPGDLRYALPLRDGPRDVTIVDVGNPQCAVVVDSLDFDWVSLGAEIERHPRFPHHTNVSFLCRVDDHTVEARFFERGAGHTLSSGTGATGAAAAALLLGLVQNPVTVRTEFCPIEVRWSDGPMHLTGPAEVIAQGQFYL